MAGRFPGAADVETFWDNLEHGREGISTLSDDELRAAGVSAELLRQPNYVKAKGVLPGADQFDAAFFGYSPREAEILDPQQRIFLECAWEALESAGQIQDAADRRVGLFAGTGFNSYLLLNIANNQAALASVGQHQALIANDKDFLTTRVSYKLNLKGPSITVQTACSTSLSAVHLACQSLLNGECDIALAGGVAVSLPLKAGYVYDPGGIASPDGHCRAFDADGAGAVAGNGVGIVVLRRLPEAREARDVVMAVIRGTAMNNDGALKAGYTAPSVDGQAEVIAEALAVADVDAATIGYVEAHGTGTPLGDPIEVAALTTAFREYTQEKGYCALGSVKTNVGHLDAAAGVTGLIKAVLAVRHAAIPPTLNFTTANPELDLDTSPFYVNSDLRPWPTWDTPRRAGVSSFGIGGTNVHVVIEQAPADDRPAPERTSVSARPAVTTEPIHVFPLSARTPAALTAGAERLAGYLEQHPEEDLDDVAYTLACRRRAFEYRQSVVFRDRPAAVAALRRLGAADCVPSGDERAPVAFLFPGQGAQYVTMARELYYTEPVFEREIDRCAELFAVHIGDDLRTLLFAPAREADLAAARLEQTAITQPALFTVEYALAVLWQSWGLRPRAMAGHSIGEYVAATVAGVFSLEDAVRLVAVRGSLVQAMPTGAMLAVFLPESEAGTWLTDDLSLAAVNSTRMCVISGPAPAVSALADRLAGAGIDCRRLHTSHAFHSRDMDGAVEPFVAQARTVTMRPPRIPFLSGVTGTWITNEQATSPEYWGRQLREPVRFDDILTELLGDPRLLLLEVGPGDTLGSFARRHRGWQEGRTLVGSLPHPRDRRDDAEYAKLALTTLWRAGAPVDWAGFHRSAARGPVPLPTYAFQRQRYWLDADPSSSALGTAAGSPAALEARSADDWFYLPGWRRLAPSSDPLTPPAAARWLVLGADLELGRELGDTLEAAGASVVRVSAGPELSHPRDNSWSLDPADPEQVTELLKSVLGPETGAGPEPLRVLHLWGLRSGPVERLDAGALATAQRLGFDTLLALARGLGAVGASAPVAVDVLCRGVFSVLGDERLQPENATLLGAATVIPQELSDVSCRALDLSDADPDRPRPHTVRAVIDLLGRSPADDRELALRGEYWWIRDFDPIRIGAEPESGTRLRDAGVYLITGGLGGVGLELAQYIAGRVQAPALGLIGRSPFPPEADWQQWLDGHDARDETSARIRRLRALQQTGARIAVLQADVTDLDQTSGAVGAFVARFGPVNGIVHAAGLPSSGLMAGKSPADAAQVLAAKTAGLLVLEKIFPGWDCDFVLLCSSTAAVLGGPGQSDYGAANRFLDVYAQWARQRSGAPIIAVGWDTWRNVGMAGGLAARLGGPAARPAGADAHPLLQRLVQDSPQSRTFATTFSTADHWIVDEHRIQGNGLVPGTAYVEIVRAMVAGQADGRVIEISDVMFSMPVIVPDGQTRQIYTTVEERDGGIRFAVRSRVDPAGPVVAGAAPGWQEHASGSVSFRDRTPAVRRELSELIEQCGPTAELIETEEALKTRLKLGEVEEGGPVTFTFGPRWRRSLRRIHAGPTRLLATLTLEEEYQPDLAEYFLHPALLDLAGAASRVHAPDVYYMPLTYRRLEIFGRLTGTVHSAIEMKTSPDSTGETMTCTIEVYDPEGSLLAAITDLTIKRVTDVEALLGQIEKAAAPPAGDLEPDPDPDTGAGPATGLLGRLSAGMSAADAVIAFGRILAVGALPEQLVVSGRDFTAIRALARSITPSSFLGEIEQLAPLGGTHPRPDLATPYVEPSSAAEQAVAAIWQEVLGIDRVGVDDDYFALGGHSLAAVQIGAKIKNHFGVEFDLRSFFDNPTVAGTAATLSASPARDEEGAPDAIPVLRRDDSGPADDNLDLDGLSDAEVQAQLEELLG